MAQLYFKYGAMGSSKTANALMARFNYEERGQATLLVKPRLDTRDGDHMVFSRIGLTHPCIYFDEMQQMTDEQLQQYACIIVDEAQFLTKGRYLLSGASGGRLQHPHHVLRPAGGLQRGAIPRQLSSAGDGRQAGGGQDHLLVRQEGRLQRPLRPARPCGEGGRSGGAGSQRQVHWPRAAATGWPGIWARTSTSTGYDLQHLSPSVRGGAHRDLRRRLLPDARCAGHRTGRAAPVGGAGALRYTGQRSGVLLRLHRWAASTARTTPSPPREVGKAVTTERLREIFRELIAQGAHNIDLITASHFRPRSCCRPWRSALPVPVVFNCGGYERVGDAASAGRESADLAAGPEIRAGGAGPATTPAPADYFPVATEAIREMFRQVGPCRMEDGLLRQGVVIRHLVLPGQLESTRRVIDWVARDLPPGGGAVLPHEPVYALSPAQRGPWRRHVTAAEYRAAAEYMENCGIVDGFVQERTSAREEYTPAFDLTGV